ncbi:MAG TPA: restriction endonuclease [Candidatus Hydrogenedentes bacterium]|nr:restriction endonuclease [Candidatus Hydrogenedentota bacterium]
MTPLTVESFERVLDVLCHRLTAECVRGPRFEKSSAFEGRVRELLKEPMAAFGLQIDFHPHPYLFPDIALGKFGVEVKFTTNDTWRSVANSVFESTSSDEVENIYVVFGKMGGNPAVNWDKYDNCVIHVRTSHVPRFEVEIRPKESLFQKMKISYRDFRRLSIYERMEHIRKYARGRLKKGERLWWLDDKLDDGHTLPIQARLYMSLKQEEKRRLRAEAALLCPQIVKPSRSKHKYDDVTLYLLTYHGVLCPQARDLFSAGSVAMRTDTRRGGNYVLRALADIEPEMIAAAAEMDDKLFVEYWGVSVSPKHRIEEWLSRADKHAVGWTPSKVLFRNTR